MLDQEMISQTAEELTPMAKQDLSQVEGPSEVVDDSSPQDANKPTIITREVTAVNPSRPTSPAEMAVKPGKAEASISVIDAKNPDEQPSPNADRAVGVTSGEIAADATAEIKTTGAIAAVQKSAAVLDGYDVAATSAGSAAAVIGEGEGGALQEMKDEGEGGNEPAADECEELAQDETAEQAEADTENISAVAAVTELKLQKQEIEVNEGATVEDAKEDEAVTSQSMVKGGEPEEEEEEHIEPEEGVDEGPKKTRTLKERLKIWNKKAPAK